MVQGPSANARTDSRLHRLSLLEPSGGVLSCASRHIIACQGLRFLCKRMQCRVPGPQLCARVSIAFGVQKSIVSHARACVSQALVGTHEAQALAHVFWSIRGCILAHRGCILAHGGCILAHSGLHASPQGLYS